MQLVLLLIVLTSKGLVTSEDCTATDHQDCKSWKKAGDCKKNDTAKLCLWACGLCNSGGRVIDGKWGVWGSWTACNKTCGGGVRTKRRHCNKPPPYNGGLECLAESNERESLEVLEEKCNEDICVDTCTNEESGNKCEEWKKSKLCDAKNSYHEKMIKLCKETCGFCGSWGSWTRYTNCSITCGRNGRRVRHRQCNNTESSPRTKFCLAKDGKMDVSEKEEDICHAQNQCPVNGSWSSWNSWTGCPSCEKRDEVGKRSRYCDDPGPQHGGLKCQTNDDKRKEYEEERESCLNILKCTVDGEWSSWTNWTGCSCDDEKIKVSSRYRECDNPQPDGDGLLCISISNNGERRNSEEETTQCTNIACAGQLKEGVTSRAYVIGAVVAAGVVLLLLCIVIIVYLKRRKKKSNEENILPSWIKEDDFDEESEDPYSGLIDSKDDQTYPPNEEIYAETTKNDPTYSPNDEIYAETTIEPTLPRENSVVYAETTNEHTIPEANGLVYADVGKGGGRIGYRLKPDQSNYAEVKTEGTYYPPCTSSNEPPVYTLPSHDFFTTERTPTYDRMASTDENDYMTQNI